MRTIPKARQQLHLWLPLLILAQSLAACDVVQLAPRSPANQASPVAATAPPLAAAPSTISPSVPSTPLPAPELLARALRHRLNGDYDAVAMDLHGLLSTYPGDSQVRSANFYLAESFGMRGRWPSAIEALRGFVAEGPQDDLFLQALFLLARAYEETGAWADAVATYERYRTFKTPLEPYAQLRQAAQEQALGRLEQAAANYEAVAGSEIARAERAGAYENAIGLRRQLGQYDS